MKSIFGKLVSVWTHPFQTLEALRQDKEEGIGSSVLFVAAMFLLAGMVSAVWSVIAPPEAVTLGQVPRWAPALMVIMFPVLFVAGSFVSTFFIWVLNGGFLRGSTGDYKTTYKLLALLSAFAPVNALITQIPKVGIYFGLLLTLWSLFLLVRGLIIVLGSPPVRAYILGGFLLLLALLGMYYGNQSDEFSGPAGFGNLEETEVGGDLTEDEAELNRALEQSAPAKKK